MTKLTKALRDEIIKSKDTKTTKGLADDFKVSQSTIRRVLKEATAEAEMVNPNEEVSLDAPVGQKPKIVMKETVPTIKLGNFQLGGKDPPLDVPGYEQIFADDEAELDTFADQWEEDSAAESVEEEEVELPRPTKKDEALLKAMEEQERNVIEQAMNPNPVELMSTAKALEDESQVRNKYMSRIYLNVINFSEHLPFIKDKEKFLSNLHKKTTKELISLSGLIETQRSLGNVANQMKHAFTIVSQGAEFGTRMIGMKTEGFTSELMKREREIEMIFQEIAVEQSDTLKSYTTPQMRLALIFTSTLMIVDGRNRVQHIRNKERPVNPDLQQQFADL
jgi:hypothetical protein